MSTTPASEQKVEQVLDELDTQLEKSTSVRFRSVSNLSQEKQSPKLVNTRSMEVEALNGNGKPLETEMNKSPEDMESKVIKDTSPRTMQPWNVPNTLPAPKTRTAEIESITISSNGIKNIEEDRHQHTVFTLQVRLLGGLQWCIEKRYSEFREFHEKLKRINPSVKQLYFPKRHMFRSKTSTVIEQRRREFEQYCKDLLNVRPFLRVSIFNFLEVYGHLESYERKQQRRRKQNELERMKQLLSKELVEDLTEAFKRLSSLNTTSNTRDSVSSQGQHTTPPVLRCSLSSFRQYILGVFPDMPTIFANRFIKAFTERQRNDINVDEFIRVIAIMTKGSLEDKIGFLFQMCDHDHANELPSSGLTNLLLCLMGRAFTEKFECRRLVNDLFESGRLRLSYATFVKSAKEKDVHQLLTSWMVPFAEILIEEPDQSLFDLQEEYNPLAQQKILASETTFSPQEVSVLQEAFRKYHSGTGIVSPSRSPTKQSSKESASTSSVSAANYDQLDFDRMVYDFELDISDCRFTKIFSSFGKRSKENEINLLSFVNALSIACRGTEKEEASFAFNVFGDEHPETQEQCLNREDLVRLVQYEASTPTFHATSLYSHIAKYLMSQNIDSIDIMALLTKSQVGLYVDYILQTYAGACCNAPCLYFEQFFQWTKDTSFRSRVLDLLKLKTFLGFGLRPASKDEENSIAMLAYFPFPTIDDEESNWVVGENWYLLEARWFEQWASYIEFTFKDDVLPDSVLPPFVSPETTTSSTNSSGLGVLASPFSMSIVPEMMNSFSSKSKDKSNDSSSSSTPSTDKAAASARSLSATYYDREGNIRRPKYFNNTPLLLRKVGGPSNPDTPPPILSIKEELVHREDFVVISEQLYSALKQWYGGGPDIVRTVAVLGNGNTGIDLYANECPDEDGDSLDDSSTVALNRHSSHSFISASTPKSSFYKRLRGGGSIGLTNLGNTCYMNSAIQCLCNTNLLTQYFLMTPYSEDVNRTSTLGLQGKVAEVYGKLTHEMWETKQKKHTSVSPRDLKKTIGKFNEVFRGNDQQDAQEFLAFLLSGLSEDLNRITAPPYVEQPDSDGRYDADLADEWWKNHLRREVSIIVALFTGQYKSLLACKTCSFQSARFEPFTFLQLPLPEPTHHNIAIRMEFAAGVPHPPQVISLRLVISATIRDLKYAIIALVQKSYNVSIEPEDLVIAEVMSSLIVSYKADNRPLTQVRSVERLVAYQLTPAREYEAEGPAAEGPTDCCTEGKLVEVRIRSSGQLNEFIPGTVIQAYPTEKLVDVRYRTGDVETMIPAQRIRPRSPHLIVVSAVSRKLNYSPIYFKNPFRPTIVGFPLLFRLCPERMTGFALYQLVWQHMKQYSSSVSSPVQYPSATEEVEIENLSQCHRIDQLFSTTNPCGFTLRRVDMKGIVDSRARWLNRSYGTTIPCTDAIIDLMDDEMLGIDWDSTIMENDLDLEKMKTPTAHSSVDVNNALDNGPVPLSYCLRTFTSEEAIDEGYCSSCRVHRPVTKKLDLWRLPPVLVIHLKRFQYSTTYRRKLSSLVKFPLYGLDVEEFLAHQEDIQVPYPAKKVAARAGSEGTKSAASMSSLKAESETEPPLKCKPRRGYTNSNLDAARNLHTQYELYAVVNHTGALGGGHYTAYAKNAMDKNWYFYDDERVRVIEESKVVTPNAYLLFYTRTDLDNVSINEVYPPNTKQDITEKDIDRILEQDEEQRCQIICDRCARVFLQSVEMGKEHLNNKRPAWLQVPLASAATSNQQLSLEREAPRCGVCLELYTKIVNGVPIVLFPCGHSFCSFCIDQHQQVNKMAYKCPLCRLPIQSQAINHSLYEALNCHPTSLPSSTTLCPSTSSIDRFLNLIANTTEKAQVALNEEELQIYTLRLHILVNELQEYQEKQSRLSKFQQHLKRQSHALAMQLQALEQQNLGLVPQQQRLEDQQRLLEQSIESIIHEIEKKMESIKRGNVANVTLSR